MRDGVNDENPLRDCLDALKLQRIGDLFYD